MMKKEVIRKAETTPIRWCIEHAAPQRPHWVDTCWELSVWVQQDDCRFIDAVLLFPERPPA